MRAPQQPRRDIEEEIDFHLEEVRDHLIHQGLTPDEAAREATRRFGDRRRYARRLNRIDRQHQRRPWMALDSLWLDLRQAARSLRAAPAFTMAALAVLTLGLGATTAIFSVVDAVALRNLPFDDAARLVAVGERRTGISPASDPQALLRMAPQNFVDVVARQRVFDAIGAYTTGAITLQRPGEDPEDLVCQRVSAGFFDVLRVRPVIGRTFQAENEVEGHHHYVVLSNALWRSRFGADPGIIGRVLPLDGAGFEVIGVMPAGFVFPVGAAQPADLWIPYFVPANERTRVKGQLTLYLQAIGRLRQGASLSDARAQMAQLAASLESTYPDWNAGVGLGIRPLREHLVGTSTASWMWMLLGAVGLVLTIACANVASLSLARLSARAREMSVRAALGSSRWRLVQQLLVESLLLSSIGTVFALLFGWILIGVLKSTMPSNVPRAALIALDLRVLSVTALAAVITGLFCGCLPAIRASRPNLSRAVSAQRGSIGEASPRLRQALVVGEIALAVVLLVGAALFIGSFISILRVDPGLTADQVLLVQLAPRTDPGQPRPDLRVEYSDIVEEIAAAPGVTRSAMILGGTPLSGSMSTTTLISGGTPLDGRTVSFRRITPDYFKALGIPLIRGRFFTKDDRDGLPRVAIISASAAAAYFPQGAIGEAVTLDHAAHTIVGVVPNTVQTDLETSPLPEAFVPIAYGARNRGDLVIRTSGNPTDVVPYVRAVMRRHLPDMPLRDIRTMASVVDRNLAARRLNMVLLSLFGLVGLAVAAVGIYGVMAFLVSQRTREIGVRLALGAPRARVMASVLGNAAALIAAGLAIGAVSAYVLSRTAAAFLFQVDARDPRAFVVAVCVLAGAGLVAAAIPARRAASVDPLVALKSD